MITTIEIYEPEQKRDNTTNGIDSIVIECWEDDTLEIRSNNIPIDGEHQFRFEVDRVDAIKIAKIILSTYER
tara:strand:+ start:184 stop:399 length:216 start_codon:yes stop_codon:yes gene_type:complete